MTGYLIEYIFSKRFLLIPYCIKYIFKILGRLNILLQSKDLNLLAAMNKIHNAQLSTNNLRSTNMFNKIATEVSDFEKNYSQFKFSNKLEHRIHFKKK